MDTTPYKVLIVGAHHEEIEVECPNIAISLSAAGCKVTILNPIGGWNWTFIRDLGPNGRERTIDDATRTAKTLGCEKVIWDYPVAQADRYQAEIMDRMAEFLLETSPDIVLMHWPLDSHADHRLVAHVTRHILSTATNISPNRHKDYQAVKEVYAFQTGVSQAYHFIPDMFVKADEATMATADKAIECFLPTCGPDIVDSWRRNFHDKAAYWGHACGVRLCEALKFLGPRLPLEGFLMKKILGDRLLSAPLASYFYDEHYQL
ncbi:MAG: PIG-L family deacetylase [Victivallales bacterium]|nr:PIG-L family deacetylase [Victivallales bacterium]